MKDQLFKHGDFTAGPTSVSFPEMNWPTVGARMNQIQWKLRYAPGSLTRGEQLTAASVMSAYATMIYDTQKKRNFVCKTIRDMALRRAVAIANKEIIGHESEIEEHDGI